MHDTTMSNLIGDDEDDASITNVFCFGAFADKQSGVMYNNLTGSFPFMSLDGSICFLVLNHYEANTIFVIPIAGLDDVTIFEAYKKSLTNSRERSKSQAQHHGQPGHGAHQEVPNRRTM